MRNEYGKWIKNTLILKSWMICCCCRHFHHHYLTFLIKYEASGARRVNHNHNTIWLVVQLGSIIFYEIIIIIYFLLLFNIAIPQWMPSNFSMDNSPHPLRPYATQLLLPVHTNCDWIGYVCIPSECATFATCSKTFIQSLLRFTLPSVVHLRNERLNWSWLHNLFQFDS